MKAYVYNQKTKQLIREHDCQVCPKTKEFMKPINSTFTKPDELSKYSIWDGESWNISLEDKLKDAKAEKIKIAKQIYEKESTKSFSFKNTFFKGGDESASAIAGAVTLANALGETKVNIIDINDKSIELTFDEALILSASIAKQWRDAFFAYKEQKVKINQQE